MKRSLTIDNSFDTDGGISPMEGTANMADAMLVLAVGIMLALVINWKIEINSSTTNNSGEKVDDSVMEEYEFDDSNQNTEVSIDDVESNYVKSGTVYTDTYTGKTYIVVD